MANPKESAVKTPFDTPCIPAMFFSNPDLKLEDHVTGDVSHNNAKWIRNIRMVIANLGNEKTQCPKNYFYDPSVIECFKETQTTYINCDYAVEKFGAYRKAEI